MKRWTGILAAACTTALLSAFVAGSAFAAPVDYRIDILGVGISGSGIVVADSDDFPGIILEPMIIDFQVTVDASVLGTDDSASFDVDDGSVALVADPLAVTGISANLNTLTDTLGIPIHLVMNTDGSLSANLGIVNVFGRYTITEEVIPEPSAALLFGCGLAVFASRRRFAGP